MVSLPNEGRPARPGFAVMNLAAWRVIADQHRSQLAAVFIASLDERFALRTDDRLHRHTMAAANARTGLGTAPNTLGAVSMPIGRVRCPALVWAPVGAEVSVFV